MNQTKRKHQAKILRLVRKVHRTMAIFLFAFFFVVSITGILLGWKKHSQGVILPKSMYGSSTNLADWLPIDSLHKNACRILHDSVSPNLSLELERIDIRHTKGMVKFVFIDHYWGIQLDGATGKLLQITKRRSDIIENIHDGSILDYFFGTKKEPIKLAYTSMIGIALFFFTATGLWLWLGPKRMRKNR